MIKIALPGICKKCGKAFLITPTPIVEVSDKSRITIHEQISKSTCIDNTCGGDALIPSGTYEWEGTQIRLIEGTDLTKSVFQKVIDAQRDVLVLFRYLNIEHIDQFRKDGTLRICLLAKYHSIGDIREDESEGIQSSKLTGLGELSGDQSRELLGINVNSIKFEKGWNKTLTHNNILPFAYVLCTSTEQKEIIKKRFGCDDYFIIHNVSVFKKALERAISKHFEIIHSLDKHVEYKVDKSENYKIEEIVKDNITLQAIDVMSFFRKTEEYSVEAEYRFLYIINSENPPIELFINLTQEEIKNSCTFH
jgi:hypothetical protein